MIDGTLVRRRCFGASFTFATFFTGASIVACASILLFFAPRTATAEGKPLAEKSTGASTIDQEYVKANLKDYLHPSSLQFLDDGRVRMTFDLSDKNKDHEKIFTPKISTNINSRFRWTVRGEEYYSSFYSRKKAYKGLRIGNSGTALLNCWFRNRVKAEVEYAQGTNFNPKQMMAIVFYTDKHRALGSNYGSQAVEFVRRRPKKGSGTVEPLLMDEQHRFGIEVREDTFDVLLDNRKKQSLAYSAGHYESGRIGILWHGGVAGFITTIVIEGELDYSRMAKELRRRRR